jgi:hypothetical protein
MEVKAKAQLYCTMLSLNSIASEEVSVYNRSKEGGGSREMGSDTFPLAQHVKNFGE